MGIEQIQSAKTRRYCPLFSANWSRLESGKASVVFGLFLGLRLSP
jgi:hypothetical protein